MAGTLVTVVTSCLICIFFCGSCLGAEWACPLEDWDDWEEQPFFKLDLGTSACEQQLCDCRLTSRHRFEIYFEYDILVTGLTLSANITQAGDVRPVVRTLKQDETKRPLYNPWIYRTVGFSLQSNVSVESLEQYVDIYLKAGKDTPAGELINITCTDNVEWSWFIRCSSLTTTAKKTLSSDQSTVSTGSGGVVDLPTSPTSGEPTDGQGQGIGDEPSDLGLIIGAVCGGVTGLLLICVVLVVYCKRRERTADQSREENPHQKLHNIRQALNKDSQFPAAASVEDMEKIQEMGPLMSEQTPNYEPVDVETRKNNGTRSGYDHNYEYVTMDEKPGDGGISRAGRVSSFKPAHMYTEGVMHRASELPDVITTGEQARQGPIDSSVIYAQVEKPSKRSEDAVFEENDLYGQ